MRDQAAVVGIGATPYWKRGQSLPETQLSMACTAILAALDDAGLTVDDLDGFSIYSSAIDPAQVASVLGVPEVRFAASLTSGGGGCAGSLGLGAAAIHAGMANVCVTVMTLQQATKRLGGSSVGGQSMYGGGSPYGGGGGVPPSLAFTAGAGLMSPGHSFAVLTQRHMHQYGTTREHLAHVAITQREYASTRPTAIRRDPLTMEDYFNARMIADPLCLLDYTNETDGAVAAVMTSADRAKDLRQPPVYILASANGGMGRWGPAIFNYFQAPDEYFASSGHRPVAQRMYEMAGVTPDDVDVALLYDHFSSMVIMQLEDYGFCGIGEGGPFVAEGNTKIGGRIPTNTHGGHLSEAYIIGMTHVREAVEQLRGTAVNQVPNAEIALVTGGPASLPVSGTLLRR